MIGIFSSNIRVHALFSVFKNIFYRPAPTDLNRIQALKSFKYLSGSAGLSLTPSGLMYSDNGNSGITALKIGKRNTTQIRVKNSIKTEAREEVSVTVTCIFQQSSPKVQSKLKFELLGKKVDGFLSACHSLCFSQTFKKNCKYKWQKSAAYILFWWSYQNREQRNYWKLHLKTSLGKFVWFRKLWWVSATCGQLFTSWTKLLNIQISEFLLIDENINFSVYTSTYKIRSLYFNQHLRQNSKFSI